MTRRASAAKQTGKTADSRMSHEMPKKKQANENRKDKPAAAVSGYGSMVQRTADLWREQLGSLMNAPAGSQDLSKLMEPAHQFFTQGVDFWLVLLNEFGKNAGTNPFSAAARFQDMHHGREKSSGNTGTNRAAAAAGGDRAGAGAVAELAARLGDIERRLAALEAGGRAVARPRARAKKKAPEAI
jgi:hypothetical protein